MVQPKDNMNAPPEGSHRLPSLPKELQAVYQGMARLGATGPASGRDTAFLAKELHENKKTMEHELHVLEGKGIVGHQTSGNETTWYLRK